jgi:hypothetical protein
MTTELGWAIVSVDDIAQNAQNYVAFSARGRACQDRSGQVGLPAYATQWHCPFVFQQALSSTTSEILRVARRFSRSLSNEFLDGGFASGEEGCGEQLTLLGETVTVGLRDLVDDPVGAEQAKLAAHAGGKLGGVLRGSQPLARIGERAEVAVSEAGGRLLAARNGLEERDVVLVADA